MTLALRHVGEAERPVLENLIQLYIHDFSEFFSGTLRCELGSDGRYPLDHPVLPWLATPGNVALLLYSDGHLAGFAQIEGTDTADRRRRVAEFFIVRKHRRTGLGTAAAAAIFELWPGQWLAEVRRRNLGAAGFWQRAITTHRWAADPVVVDRRDEQWDGPEWQFRVEPPPGKMA